MDNMFNLNQVSQKTVDTDKRIEKQAQDFLAEQYKKEREEEEARENALHEEAMSSARFSYAASIARSKGRVRALEEEIKYTNTATTVAMTEMVSEVVESGLLLDEEEYRKLNPEFREEIRATVRGFLENADIQMTTNPDTLVVMEYVSKVLPNAKDGKYLTEDELGEVVRRQKPVEVESAIRKLSGNVSTRVATLVEKEQKKVNEIQKDLETVAPKAAKNQKPAEEAADEIPEEKQSVEGQEELSGEPVDGSDKQPMEETGEEMPVENGEEVAPEMDGSGKSIHIGSDGTTSIQMSNGSIALNSDGSMDIQLSENTLVRETPRSGLLESLAVNEATNMLSEGKEYNPDLCLANAIMYMTITEAMGEMGLLDVNQKTYAKIISTAGGNLLESAKTCDSAKKVAKLKAPKTVDLPKEEKELDLAERIRQKRLAQEKAKK